MQNPLTTEDLLALAKSTNALKECATCKSLFCLGWESLPYSFNRDSLTLIGTLRTNDEEVVWEEYHPNGTQLWSPDAPIAIDFHPYNRCDVYQCKECRRIYLRYTEYGGYYVDERIRTVNPNLIVTLPKQ